ncbi:hypothetical protein LCGC14_2191060 [marine sediment metagenome]|uniref:Uncharacterized protein n=1 Tax=marine sediment metagenome TaxID=412755 RepID=A0A0F9DJQ6_9ZZZZ
MNENISIHAKKEIPEMINVDQSLRFFSILRKSLKDEDYDFCPLCDSKLSDETIEPKIEKPLELLSINEDDWLLP